MAPRPLSTTIRTSRPGRRSTAAGPPKPSIYAVHSGPQRGVHLLSPDPPPLEVQYLYRHPINHHPTFLTFSGDFLRRRFDSIEAAVKWIDERDREEELVSSLASTTIGNGKQPAASSSAGSELERLPRRRDDRSLARREPVYGVRKTSAVEKRRWEEREAKSTPKEGGARFSYSHVGVRRRELLYNMVAGGEAEGSRDAEEKKRKELVAVKSPMKDGETPGGVKADEMEVEEEL